MHIETKPLKPLESVELTPDEQVILKWIRSAKWEVVANAKEPIPYKAKVPEFYLGVKLYRKQAGGPSAGSLGVLEIFIKKLGFAGIINKQDLYPVSGFGNESRHLLLKKTDLDNLGVGKEEEE